MTGVRRHVTPHALARLLGDWREGPGPLYERLSRRVAHMLADGRLAPDVRLPAERPLAEALGLSRTTVVGAYALLREQGLLESRRGAGSVTRFDQATAHGHRPWAPGSRLEERAGDLIDLSKASPPADEATLAALRRAAERAGGLVGDDGYHPLGLRDLRAAIAERYATRGVPTAPEQILVTAGAQQAVDLLVRTLVRNRETVVVESPTYPGAMDSLRQAGARMVALDVSGAGWDLEAFESLVVQTGARLAYLMPDFQNPTGRLMDDADRARLARLCRRHGVTAIVDETLAEIVLEEGEDVRPMAAHDASDGVVSVGSLSKAVWGGLRVGWIRATRRQVAALAATRTTADLGGAPVEQLAAVELLADLSRLLDERRPAIRRQRDAVVAAARRLGWTVGVPRGGLSAWMRLPHGSSSVLADAAYRYGVVLIPGPRLSPDGALDGYLRIPYSMSVQAIAAAAERLGQAWNDGRQGTRGDRILQVV